MSASDVATAGIEAQTLLSRDALYRRIALRLLPFLFIAYLVNLMDRTNVGYAKLQFVSDLHFTEADYGFGAGLFFVGYLLFEVPSNVYLRRVGVRKTLLRIMVLWGFATMLMSLVQTPTHFFGARFLLGAAEGGFYPGILFYLTYWFPSDKKCRAYALFQMANPLSGIVGALIAGWVMSQFSGLMGLHGWQILFIVEGLPAVLLGVAAFFYLDDTPAQAKWLSPSERDRVREDVSKNETVDHTTDAGGLRRALTDIRVYIIAAVYFTQVTSSTLISLWGPSVIQAVGVTDVGKVGLVSTIPYAAGFIGMYFIGRSSDRTLERRWHYMLCALCASAGALLLASFHSNTVLSIAFLSLIAFGVYGGFGVLFTIPAALLHSSARAAGIALVTTIGSLAGFVMPALIGWIKAETGSLFYGVALVGFVSLIGALILNFGIPSKQMPRA